MFGSRALLTVICLSLALAALPLRAETAGEYELKAALIYKFSQFTEWPAFPVTEFAVCVLGQDPFRDAINGLNGKLLRGAKVTVKRIAGPDEAKGCQALFVNPANLGQLRLWMASLRGLPILTVSDAPDAWQEGVMIVLNNEPNRIAFSINVSQARRVGMDFPAQMLNLAREVR